ncbi:MAG: hypothetical protein RL208_647 [Pseudomonadota bacterium]
MSPVNGFESSNFASIVCAISGVVPPNLPLPFMSCSEKSIISIMFLLIILLGFEGFSNAPCVNDDVGLYMMYPIVDPLYLLLPGRLNPGLEQFIELSIVLQKLLYGWLRWPDTERCAHSPYASEWYAFF